MAKVAFSKLKCKINETEVPVQIGEEIVMVKQYLPIQDKLALIGRVIERAHEEDYNFSNPVKADVITSRALGDVSHLIEWGRNFYKTDTLFLLLKGENVDSELKMVSRDFKCKKIPSIVDNKGCILNIKEVNY